MRLSYKLLLCLSVGLTTYSQFTLAAYTEPAYSTEQLTQAADIVFKGKVIDVSYSQSKTTDGNKGIPYTFVTYAIAQILKGNYADPTITLRFAGGPTAEGGFLLPSETTLFDKDEEDVLFVSNNNTSICPLVNCAEGRIRVINNQLYDDEGNSLLTDNKGAKLYKGSANALPEVINHKIGHLNITLTPSKPLPANSGLKAAGAQSNTTNLNPLTLATLEQQIKSTPTVANAASKLPSRTADISQPIIEKPSIAVAPAKSNAAAMAARAANFLAPLEQLEKERQALETQQNQPNFADKGLTPAFK